LNINGLIRREQFEAKVIDIVESGVSNQIAVNVVKDYLTIFKKMLDNNQIDEKIYDKISNLLLARCEVSGNSQETLTKKREKILEIEKDDSLSDLRSKVGESSLSAPHACYLKGLYLLEHSRHNEGINFIARAANLGHTEAKRYLKANKLETKAKKLLRQKKIEKTHQIREIGENDNLADNLDHSDLEARANLKARANYLLRPNKVEKTHQIRVIGENEKYLQSKKIEKPPDTHLHDKDNILLKDQNRRNSPDLEKNDNLAETPQRGFFGKLVNGDYGLAKTYWLYGGLVGGIAGGIVSLIPELVQSIGLFFILMLCGTAYHITIAIGTWRAASKYQGSKIWAVLAKISVVIGLIFLTIVVLGMFSLLVQP
jgi:gas vesicle protein